MFVALNLNKTAKVSIYGKAVSIPFSGMADGCVGCLLAFDTKEAALGYAGEGGSIIEVGYV